MDAAVARAYMVRRKTRAWHMFDSLYPRLKALAQGPRAEGALAAVAFAESSFFPIPPDVLLAPMVLAKPARLNRQALVFRTALPGRTTRTAIHVAVTKASPNNKRIAVRGRAAG